MSRASGEVASTWLVARTRSGACVPGTSNVAPVFSVGPAPAVVSGAAGGFLPIPSMPMASSQT